MLIFLLITAQQPHTIQCTDQQQLHCIVKASECHIKFGCTNKIKCGKNLFCIKYIRAAVGLHLLSMASSRSCERAGCSIARASPVCTIALLNKGGPAIIFMVMAQVCSCHINMEKCVNDFAVNLQLGCQQFLNQIPDSPKPVNFSVASLRSNHKQDQV